MRDVALTSRVSTQKVSLNWQFLTSKHGQHQWKEGQVGVRAPLPCCQQGSVSPLPGRIQQNSPGISLQHPCQGRDIPAPSHCKLHENWWHF